MKYLSGDDMFVLMADSSCQGYRTVETKQQIRPLVKYHVINLQSQLLSVDRIFESFLTELWLIARIKAADRLAPKHRETGKSALAVTAPLLLL